VVTQKGTSISLALMTLATFNQAASMLTTLQQRASGTKPPIVYRHSDGILSPAWPFLLRLFLCTFGGIAVAAGSRNRRPEDYKGSKKEAAGDMLEFLPGFPHPGHGYARRRCPDTQRLRVKKRP